MPGLSSVPLSTGLSPIRQDPDHVAPSPAPRLAPSPALAPAACTTIKINMNSEIRTLTEGRNDFQIRSLLSSTVRPPLTYSNNDLCCAYHLKGRCFTNCSPAYNYQTLSATEAVRLCDFVPDHIVQPDLGRPQNVSSSWMGGPPAVLSTTRCRNNLDPASVDEHLTIVSNKLYSLGEFIALANNVYLNHNLWEAQFHSQKKLSNLRNYLWNLWHKASPLLDRYAKSFVLVFINFPPWKLERKDQEIDRGNHPSAHAFTAFLKKETDDMRRKGMFVALLYQLLRDLPQLQKSPLDYVPQQDRHPSMINYYTYAGVNPSTIKAAPPESIDENYLFYVTTESG